MKCAVYLVFSLVIFLTGCGGMPVGGQLENSSWKLVAIREENSLVQIPDTANLLLEFNEDQITGHSGCNNFFGSYSTGEGTISITGLGATRMFCPDNMQLEKNFSIFWRLQTPTRYAGKNCYSNPNCAASFFIVFLLRKRQPWSAIRKLLG